jgi:ribosomal protein L37AE/L43A
MNSKTFNYDALTARLLVAGVKSGSKPLQRLAQHAMQSLRGGACPECGSTGDHETNGHYWQCADRECGNTWEDGENIPTTSELVEKIFEGERIPLLVTKMTED